MSPATRAPSRGATDDGDVQYATASALPHRGDDGVPSILVSPASPHVDALGGRRASDRAGAAGERGSVQETGRREEEHDGGSPGTGGKAATAATTAPTPAPASASHVATHSRRPSATDAPAPAPQQRGLLSSLASALPSLPSFSLASLLPTKLPTEPTLRPVRPGEAGSSDESVAGSLSSSGSSSEGSGSEGEGEEARGKRRRRRGEGRRASEGAGRARRRAERERGGSGDLQIEQATTGPSVVSDSPSPSSPAKPAFATLARTPSSAFVAASAEGRVNPLVLQAIARRDSEYEAIRVVREQVERERRRESSGEAAGGGEGGSGEGGGGGGGERPNLLRKQSWTAMARAAGVNVGGGAGGTSESPTQMSDDELPRSSAGSSLRARRGERGTALGLVSEEGGPSAHSGDGQERTDSGDTITPAARSTDPSGSTRRPLSAQPLVDAPSPSPAARAAARNRNVSSMSTSSALSIDPAGSSAGGKKRGSFRSFFSPSRTPSQNLSAQGPGPVASSTGAAREPMTPPMSAASANGAFPGPADSPALGGIERRETKAEKGEKVIRPKVRAKGKSTKEFNDLFLAQELPIPWPSSGPSPIPARDGAGDNESVHSGAPDVLDSASLHSHATHDDERSGGGGAGGAAKGGKKKKAVWAVKFSEDGKFLAVGGKDGVVRVWEVLSTPEEREATLAAASTSQQFDPVPLSTTEAPAGSRMSGVPATPSSPVPPPTPTVGPSGRKKGSSGPREPVCVMPVFASKPVREFKGHEADVLDLSWSKNNFLLSSSMDKTVRLWHVSRNECLCAFQHLDFVTSIAFHPKDDRFFLSGSLDCKLRLWNIPEKRVHIWTELPELITAVSFTRDGKLAIAGTFVGAVMFFEVETFRYHAQFAAKSSRGKNSKGKKVTSLTPFPLPSSTGERLLVTTNDSRLRLYHTADKILETKYAGHENTSSQIRASFSDDGRWIISGSEDRNVYMWDSGLDRRDDGGFHLRKKQKDSPHEHFAMFAHIVTAAVFAPTHSREHLAAANDPIFADGHTHFAPLEQTMSGASLDLAGVESHNTTCDSIPRSVLVPATSRDGKAHPTAGGAQDAILVVADDETGTISVFRNSKLSPATLAPLASPALSAGAASSLKRDKSKRWSRMSEAGRS